MFDSFSSVAFVLVIFLVIVHAPWNIKIVKCLELCGISISNTAIVPKKMRCYWDELYFLLTLETSRFAGDIGIAIIESSLTYWSPLSLMIYFNVSPNVILTSFRSKVGPRKMKLCMKFMLNSFQNVSQTLIIEYIELFWSMIDISWRVIEILKYPLIENLYIKPSILLTTGNSEKTSVKYEIFDYP